MKKERTHKELLVEIRWEILTRASYSSSSDRAIRRRSFEGVATKAKEYMAKEHEEYQLKPYPVVSVFMSEAVLALM